MTEKAISPLRRRLIEDMAIRRLGPKTQHQYLCHVKRFADFLGREDDGRGDADGLRPAGPIPPSTAARVNQAVGVVFLSGWCNPPTIFDLDARNV